MTLIAPRVAVDPEIRFGKPVIAGTRVPVAAVVGAVAAGVAWTDIAREYGITEEDIRAALAYAAGRLEEGAVFTHGLASPAPTPGSDLLRFGGTISSTDLEAMEQVIQEGCEKVDPNAW